IGSALYWGPTPASEALALIDADNDREVSPSLRIMFQGGHGIFLALAGRVEEGKPLMDGAIKAHEDLGQTMAAVGMRFGLGNAEATMENWSAAVREMKAACDELQALGEKASFSTLAGMLSSFMYDTCEFD